MAKVYTVKFVVDGQVVYMDRALLTKEEVQALEADGMIITAN